MNKLKICLADDDFEVKFRRLEKLLRLRMNGETSEQMSLRNVSYTTNYGASLPHIKELAAQCNFTPSDCRRLWLLNIREAMLIAAISLPNPKVDEMLDWSQHVHTPDMAEQASFFLFARTDEIDKFLISLIGRTGHAESFAIACFSAAKALLSGRAVADETLRIILSSATQKTRTTVDFRGLSFLARQIVRRKSLPDALEVLMSELKKSNENAAQQAFFEVQNEIDMMF